MGWWVRLGVGLDGMVGGMVGGYVPLGTIRR